MTNEKQEWETKPEKEKKNNNNKSQWIVISNKTVTKPSEARKCSSECHNQSMLGTRL